jgi:hypothetical protein
MSNPISPYYAVTLNGNVVYVSEFNDECANAEVKALHAFEGITRWFQAGDVQVIPKWQLGLITAISPEVATNLLTIKLGAINL